MTARLRELADTLRRGDCNDAECLSIANEMTAILDADGDGGAVAEVIAGYSIKWLPPDYACSLAAGTKLYVHPQPVRSGVVSVWKDPTGFSVEGIRDEANNWTSRETGKEMLLNYAAALEHFAKGERHE